MYRSGTAVFVFQCVMGGLIIVFAAAFTAFFFAYRHHPLLQFGFAPFRSLINVGALLAAVSYGCLAIPTYLGTLNDVHCTVYEEFH
jgi:hypothetical protein